MTNWRTWVTGLAAAVLATCCGTVCNLAGGIRHPESEPRVYGGLQKDFEAISSLASGGPLLDGQQGNDGRAAAFFVGLIAAVGVAEVGLTFVGDTLTLPLTACLQERRASAEQAKVKRVLTEEAAATASPGEPSATLLPPVVR